MERRRDIRRHLIFYLRILDERDNLIGYLADISEGGLMIINENTMQIGKRMTLKLKLPSELNQGEYLIFEGEVRWVQQDINNDYYDIGIKILDQVERNIEILSSLIDKIGFIK